MKAIVIDASVALSWCFLDDRSGVANEAFLKLDGRARWVPTVFSFEVANLLVQAEKKNRVLRQEARLFVEKLESYELETDPESTAYALHDTHALAREYGLTAYDAAYLELALRKGAILATLDMELRRAAVKAGVPVITEGI